MLFDRTESYVFLFFKKAWNFYSTTQIIIEKCEVYKYLQTS
jgi:hypothetical protein